MKALIFSVCITLFSIPVFGQSVYQINLEFDKDVLINERDSLQALFHPVFETVDSSNWRNDKTAEYFVNLVLGYSDYAAKLKEDPEIIQNIKKNNYDTDYYFKLSRKISLLNKKIDLLNSHNEDNSSTKRKHHFLKNRSYNKRLKRIGIKSGEKILIITNTSLANTIIYKYKNLELYLGYYDTLNLESYFLTYNLDNRFSEIIKNRKHKIIFVDMDKYSQGFYSNNFDKIILSDYFNFQDSNRVDKIKALMNDKTILYFIRPYRMCIGGKKYDLKFKRTEFENTLTKNGFIIVKSKKIKEKFNVFLMDEMKMEKKKFNSILYIVKLRRE